MFNKNETQSNNVNNTVNKTPEQSKINKKIDESKPWVYDAEYCLDNENKKAVGLYEGE